MAAMRESMVDRVRQRLLERILHGDLPPGTRLTELALAAELQTSQGPIREALRELEALGLVIIEPYKGSRVREISEKDLHDAYVVRAELERLAGQLAAPHLQGKTADLSRLEAHIRKAALAGDRTGYAHYDIEFHRAIVAAADNSLLLRSWDGLGFHLRIQLRLAGDKVNLVSAQESHALIVAALEDGNGLDAGKLLHDHVSSFAM